MEQLQADEAATDGEERFVDVGEAFVADAKAAVLVQPGDCSLDDPAMGAEPGSVRFPRPSDLRLDIASAELPAALTGM